MHMLFFVLWYLILSYFYYIVDIIFLFNNNFIHWITVLTCNAASAAAICTVQSEIFALFAPCNWIRHKYILSYVMQKYIRMYCTAKIFTAWTKLFPNQATRLHSGCHRNTIQTGNSFHINIYQRQARCDNEMLDCVTWLAYNISHYTVLLKIRPF